MPKINTAMLRPINFTWFAFKRVLMVLKLMGAIFLLLATMNLSVKTQCATQFTSRLMVW